MEIDLGQTQRMVAWLKEKIFLNAISQKAKNRAVRRGQVYRCNFGIGIGSEMQKDRPALIIQNDVANVHSGNTIVVPITHDASDLPCVANIITRTTDDGTVVLDGQANVANIMCVSKARLGNYIATLSSSEMKLVDEALAKTTGLMSYYADIKKRLNDKLDYIDRIKEQRNCAQDELKSVQERLVQSNNEALSTK